MISAASREERSDPMGTIEKAKKPLSLPGWVQTALQRQREYPIIDTLVVLYVAAVLVFQIFLQISPIVTFLTKTPFYSMQTYFGILGGGLILLDLFTTKRLWQGKFSWLLYGICLLAAVASVRTLEYGIRENLFKLCWAAIYFALVYSLPYRMSRETLHRFIKILFCFMLSLWFIACCISLYQYAAQIGYMYVVNPLSKDASATRQGFYDNRLFGIFYTLNHAAYISLLFIIGSFFYMIKTKHWSIKILLGVAELVMLCYILLSGSRSAAIALLICFVAGALLLLRDRRTERKRFVLPIILAVVVAVVCVVGNSGMKAALSHIPYITDRIVYYLHGGDANPNAKPSLDASDKGDASSLDDILDRQGLEEDVSNGRLSIWLDYVSLYNDVGLVGLSPGNYMAYVLENHPDMYIVEYVRENYPDKYNSNIIYHTHNGYLLVFVATGFLGMGCLIAFMLLCAVRVFRALVSKQTLSRVFIGAFLVVIACAFSAILDEGLFFQNHLHITLFWFSLGILMMESPDRNVAVQPVQ